MYPYMERRTRSVKQVPGAVEQESGLSGIKVKDLTASVTTASTLIAPRNSQRAWIVLTNDGDYDIYLQLDGPAVANKGILLNANGGGIILDHNTPFYGEIFGIAPGGTSIIVCQEIYYE